jgi:hypothetical protein
MLRRRVDARLDKGVIARLELDNLARQERDVGRHGTVVEAI